MVISDVFDKYELISCNNKINNLFNSMKSKGEELVGLIAKIKENSDYSTIASIDEKSDIDSKLTKVNNFLK